MSDLGLGRWDWLLLSVAISTLASLLHWVVRDRARARDGAWRAVLAVLESPWIVQPLRLAYAVGLPAALLFWQHTLSTRGLGLQPLPGANPAADVVGGRWEDWAHDIGWTILVAAATWGVIKLGDRGAAPVTEPQPHRYDLLAGLREAVYHQVHWAFYREPFVFGWGLALGSWLGAVPVVVESVLNVMLWERIHTGGPAQVRAIIVRAGLYVAGTLVFLKTQNLWMAIALDAVVGWLLLPCAEPAPCDSPVPDSAGALS